MSVLGFCIAGRRQREDDLSGTGKDGQHRGAGEGVSEFLTLRKSSNSAAVTGPPYGTVCRPYPAYAIWHQDEMLMPQLPA